MRRGTPKIHSMGSGTFPVKVTSWNTSQINSSWKKNWYNEWTVCIAGCLCLVCLAWGCIWGKKKGINQYCCVQLALEVYSHLKLVLPDQTWHTSGKCCRDLAILWVKRGTCGGPTEAFVVLTEHLAEDLNPIQDPQHNCLPQTDIMWPGSLFLRSELNISLDIFNNGDGKKHVQLPLAWWDWLHLRKGAHLLPSSQEGVQYWRGMVRPMFMPLI